MFYKDEWQIIVYLRIPDLPRSLYKLVKNPILLSSVFGSSLAAFLLTGYTAELSTYLRLQFQSSVNAASIAASKLAFHVRLAFGDQLYPKITWMFA